MSESFTHNGHEFDFEPVFIPGQRVIATCSYMHLLTEGKEYTVTEYTPSDKTEYFTWPAYVTVVGDFGKKVSGHTYRFKAVTPEVQS